MNIGNMKNMVILKDIPSNMVEEAIVIFKPNIKIEQRRKEEKKKENIKVGAKGKEISKDYIVKEAESIVSQYISNLERPHELEVSNQKLLNKYNRMKTISILCAIVGILGITINLF